MDSTQIGELVDYVAEECDSDPDAMRTVADAIKVEAEAIEGMSE